MDALKQRIAIAEECGFRRLIEATAEPCWRKRDALRGEVTYRLRGEVQIPDYLNDLNAMHEAEKYLTFPHLAIWRNFLVTIVWEASGRPQWYTSEREISLLFATAKQRAEAFLKTINKWENE